MIIHVGLNLSDNLSIERLNLIKQQNEFEAMVLKENVDMRDITWVEAHAIEFPELRVELQPQRYYPLGTTLACTRICRRDKPETA